LDPDLGAVLRAGALRAERFAAGFFPAAFFAGRFDLGDAAALRLAAGFLRAEAERLLGFLGDAMTTHY
jgi:hypothetical protein